MSNNLLILNIALLIGAIGFAMYRLSAHGNKNLPSQNHSDRMREARKEEKKQADTSKKTDDSGTTDSLNVEETELNAHGDPYKIDEWRFFAPQCAKDELQKVYTEKEAYHLQRAIELSIEHLMHEINDDMECARIIEERVKPDAKTISYEEMMQKMAHRINVDELSQKIAQHDESDTEIQQRGDFIADSFDDGDEYLQTKRSKDNNEERS